MNNSFVVDASVIAKLLLDEKGSDRVRELWRLKKRWLVPEILFVEIANTLATKPVITADQITEGLELVYDLGLEVVSTNKVSLVEAARLAKQKGTAVYDMLYAVLAKALKIELLTADENFAQKTKFDFVRVLGN